MQAKQGPDKHDEHAIEITQENHVDAQHDTEVGHSAHEPPDWIVLPFMVLLLLIASGPIFLEHFWHKNYPYVSIVLSAFVVSYYIFNLENYHSPIHALAEYVQFIALLSSLYMASAGIVIDVNYKCTPKANIILLVSGAIISNLIGTTGASMLLIRPFIRLNKEKIKPYHVVFFIFMVSNVGGSLTPIGDPPLFLGFLKGVPFTWTITHNIAAWAFVIVSLSVAFYFIDKRNPTLKSVEDESRSSYIGLRGAKNFGWLVVIIFSVFIDPNVIDGVPAIMYHGQKISYIREVIMLSVAYLSYKTADQSLLKANDFNMEPIREVAFIFIGIFGTMMPALEMVGSFAKSDAGAALITHNILYWGTGTLSGFLDNAPTYLNFLAAAMASQGADIQYVGDVVDFSNGGIYSHSILNLKAISIAAVFFGAMTYIGNGPNFMVKSIAEQLGINMPSFFGYIIRFSVPILLPILFLVWLLFFAFY